MRYFGKTRPKAKGSRAKKDKALADRESGVVYQYKPRYKGLRPKKQAT